MTIKDLLSFGNSQLQVISSTPLLDARVLVCHFLRCSFADLLIRENEEVSNEVEKSFTMAIEKRKQHFPVAYITGKKEFFGREFEVNESVLIPRPETEELVEYVLKGVRSQELGVRKDADSVLLDSPTTQTTRLHDYIDYIDSMTLLDLGTGSGCIAITLKKEMPELKIFAGDISKKALEVAQRNAKKHQADISFFQTDLLSGVRNQELGVRRNADCSFFDIIIANLPYVVDSARDKSILHEPERALFSGVDGLDHYRRLAAEIQDFQETNGFPVCNTLVLEIDDAQAETISKIFVEAKSVKIIKDIGGKRRIAVIQW